MIGKNIAHYKIIEEVGRGGMGIVYLAQDTKLERQVAIKFLPPHISASADQRKRFQVEAKAAAALNHPNIATIHAIEETENEIFIVMEYIPGKELKSLINSSLHSTEKTIDIAFQIAKGLQAAHRKKIIHRDIKSTNIMITDDNTVKIMDFGLAKIRGGAEITQEKSTLGTVAYMSPEQTRGEEVDQRSDIWSFGIVLYEMITGQLPFRGDYEHAISYSIINEMPPPVESLQPGVPTDLENIIYQCLEKDPTKRYQTVEELLENLKLVKEESHYRTSKKSSETLPTKRKPILIISSISAGILISIALIYFAFINRSEDSTVASDRKIMVVLPFKNLGSPEDEYFADGISEEITSRLSEIRQLGVIGRTSAELYKNTEKSIDQIGEELGLDYLLAGSVRWEKIPGSENRIRVTTQLIKASDGTQIWTKRYDAILESVFDLQSDIAEKVAMALDIKLLGSEKKSISQKPTDNLEAYDYYLRGNDHYLNRGQTEDNFKIAERMYLKAIELDSNFTLAYTKLSELNSATYWHYFDRDKNRILKSKDYIDQALKRNPNIPDIYLALGQYFYYGFLDYDKALNEFEKGLKLKPDHDEILAFIGYVKRRQGEFVESIKFMKKGLELNPHSDLNEEIGYSYLIIREYEQAIEYFDKSLSIMPELAVPYHYKAWAQIYQNGDTEKASQFLKNGLDIVTKEKWYLSLLLIQIEIFKGDYSKALTLLSQESRDVWDNQFYFYPKNLLAAIIYGLQHNKELEINNYKSAKVIVEAELQKYPNDSRLHSSLGIIYAGMGQKEKAIEEGEFAAKLLPFQQEAWRGYWRELDLAKINTIVGEYDQAIDKLDYLLSIPGELSVPYIKIDPVWRPLSDIPRFQKVLKKYN